jgi:UDP-2,3-diacylglucosamine hydrolase
LDNSKKIFFASDFHLGLKAGIPPMERERRITSWLDQISGEAREIYLLGDVFDFWWEYKHVVPRGFTRFLGKIGTITDSGIPVHFFPGNHDMWVGDYLEKECGMTIHTAPLDTVIDGKKFHLAHGEGLGTTSTGYKMLLWIFRNKPLRILYTALHPSIGMGIGHRWSLSSRLGKGISLDFLGEEKEDLIRYSKSILEKENKDYFIFGHRHLAMKFMMPGGVEIFFLGDWIKHSSYAVWDGRELVLKQAD